MIKSIDIGELSQDLTNKKVSVFPFAVYSEKHKEVPTHRHNFYEIILIELGSETQTIDDSKQEISKQSSFSTFPLVDSLKRQQVSVRENS